MNEDMDIARLEARLASFDDGPDEALERIDTLVELGWAIGLADFARSRTVSEEAQRLAERVGHDGARALARRNLAYNHLVEGRVKEAVSLCREVAEELQEVGDEQGYATALDVLYNCFEQVGDYKQALQCALHGLEINRRLEHPRGEAWSLHNLGSIYAQNRDFDTSVDYYQASLERFEELDYQVGSSRVMSRLGIIYHELGRYEEALDYQTRARDLLAEAGVDVGAAMSDSDIGLAFEAMGRTEDAREAFARAIDGFRQRAENRNYLGKTLLALARLERGQGHVDLARQYLEEALSALEGGGSTTIELEAAATLAEICEADGDVVGALAHSKRHHELYKQIFDAESRSELQNLRIRADLERAEKDAEIHRLRYIELAEMQSRLLNSERMATLGGLAAGLAHEVNTPLGALRANLDLLGKATRRIETALEDPTRAAKGKAALGAMRTAIEVSGQAERRIEQLIQSLARFTGLDEADYRTFEVVEGLESALTLLGARLPDRISVVRRFEPVPAIQGHASELNQTFMTLLVNAIEAMDDVGTLELGARVEGDEIIVHIRDTGRGMDPDQLAKLFDLGFSRSGSRVRFHLGLPTAAATIEKHGGRIEVDSELGEGTTFTLHLPLQGPRPDASGPRAAASPAPTDRPRS